MYSTHIQKLARTRLDDVLLDEGVLPRDKIEFATAEHERTGKPLSQVLFEADILDEWELAKLIAKHYALPFLDVTDYSLTAEVVHLLPLEMCQEHGLLPLDVFGGAITLAVCEMPSRDLLRKITERCGKTPFFYVAVRHQIDDALVEINKNASGPARMVRTPTGETLLGTPSAARGEISDLASLPWVSFDLAASVPIGAGRGAASTTYNPTPMNSSVGIAALLSADRPAVPEPPRPQITHRVPPVVPSGASAAALGGSKRVVVPPPAAAHEQDHHTERQGPQTFPPRTPQPDQPAPGPDDSSAGFDTSWETIFDLGNDNVKKRRT